MITTNGKPILPGVVAESSRGHYASTIVVGEALELGWDDPDARRALSQYSEYYDNGRWEFFDAWYDIVSEAEDWLNENTEGGVWHWFDGEFRVDTDEDYAEGEWDV